MKTLAQKKQIIKIFFIFLFLGVCSLRFAFKTNAQSALGLSAIPPRLEVTVKPGEHITKEIKVRNESNTDRIINTDVVDFIVTDNKGTPVRISKLEEKNNRWATSDWIQVGKQLKLKAGETKSLMVTIIVPENATPGGHYAMILHNPNNEAVLSESGSSSSIETNVGTLVYVTVSGAIKQNAKVNYFTAPFFQEYGPIPFQSQIANLSDIHIKPIGQIKITNMLGLKTAEINFNEKDANIFPYTSRNFENLLDKKFLFGRYKAQLKLTYGTAGGALLKTLAFWVIPWKLIVMLIAAITIIVLLLILFKKPTKQDQNETIEDLEKELEKLRNKYKDKR